MSAASRVPGVRYCVRVVREGMVTIDGRTYQPLSDDVPHIAYTGQLDGYSCLFSRYVNPDRPYSRRLTLYGVWDPGEREYIALKGPHIINGRFLFVEWFTTEVETP